MRGTGAKGRDMISSIWVGRNLRKLWEEQEQRDEIWLVLYEWVQIYASYERKRRKGMRYDQFYRVGTNLRQLWEEQEQRDEIWSVLYEWVQIYASYERNRSKGTRYDQFYMSGYKSTLFVRGTGAKGRDMISSIWVGRNLRKLWEEQEQRDEIWSVLYELVQIYARYERNRSKGTRYDQFYMSGCKSMLVMRGTGAKGRDMISSIWVGTNLR